MKKTICFCDVCKGRQEVKQTPIQVIFTTEQNEGRFCKPYLEKLDIDICKKCMDRVLFGNYIYASGAMGNNKYEFKSFICNDLS